MEYFQVGDTKTKFTSIDALLKEVDKDLTELFPIVDEEIDKFHKHTPELVAHRFTNDEFRTMFDKLEKRRKKYATPENKIIIEEVNPPISSAKEPKSDAPLNQILYGPPGTGKTYNTINKAIEIINPSFNFSQSRSKIKEEFERLIIEKQIVFTTFHQNMSYEDFIEGIKPETTDENEVIYDIKPGIFKQLCDKAKRKEIASDNFEVVYGKLLKEIKNNKGKLVLESLVHSKEFTIYENSKRNLRFHANTEKHYEAVIRKEVLEQYVKTGETTDWPSYVKAIGAYLVSNYHYSKQEQVIDKKYVLIIDEINRGNISQIFGELITLIEEDKRIGKDEELEIILPYSKKPFGVPSNLYIIGTMNTADRSVEALDAALRRRFCFEEMLPKPELIATIGKGIVDGIDLVKLLTLINKRIEKLLDKDHQIGHSYLLTVNTLNDLMAAFYTKIIPLLQEYFFGDYGKIGLVFGKGFIRDKTWNKDSDSFAEFDYESASDFEDRNVFEIIDYRNPELNYSLEHKKTTVQMTFYKAIMLLMKEEIE